MAQSSENGFESAKYEAEGASIDVRIRAEDGTAWLTAAQIANLYGRERSVVSKHIKEAFRIMCKGRVISGKFCHLLPDLESAGHPSFIASKSSWK